MAVIRRNPGVSAMVGSICLFLAIGLLLWTRTPAHAQQNYPPLSLVSLGEIEQLRQAAGLSDDGLACLNLPADRLELLLAGIRGWHQRQGAQWLAARNAVADEQGRIRGLETDAALGHDQRRALDEARGQLVQLQSALDAQVAALRSSVLNGFSDDQQRLLDRIRTRHDIPMPYCTLDLSADQNRALTEAIVNYHQRLAIAAPEERSALDGEFGQQVAGIIGAGNVRTLNELGDYLGGASERLVSTLQLVFPVQPEG